MNVSFTSSVVLPHSKAGRIKTIAVTGAKRTPLAPDIPTIHEAGLPGYEVVGWYGMAAPAKTPRPIIDKLNAEITKYLNTPEARKYFANAGYDLIPGTPEEFTRYHLDELALWSSVAKAANVQVE